MAAITWGMPDTQGPGARRSIRGAAICVVFAGLVHLFLAPQHLDHLGHALFLMMAGVTEVAWGLALWRNPSAALYGLGVVLAGAFILLWAITRVLPAPFGHGAGDVEVVGLISKVAEGAGLAGLLTMVFLGTHSGEIRWPTGRMILAPLTLAVIGAFVLYGAGLAAERVFPWLGDQAHSGIEQRGQSAVPDMPSVAVLQRMLTRSGFGPTPKTTVDVTYAPPLLLRSTGEEAPQANLERPTAIFFVLEENPDHHAGFGPGPIRALLRVDKGEAIEPSEAAVLLDDGHGYRRSRLLFPLPSGMDPERLSRQEHTLTLIMPLGSAGESVFSWALPLGFLKEAPESALRDQPVKTAVSALSQRLTKVHEGLTYGGKTGIKVEATYATADYFIAALPSEAASRYLPDRFTAFAVTEGLHTADLPSEPLHLSMRLDGREYQPDMRESIAVSPHHRATLVRFPVAPPSGLEHHVLELRLSGGESLTWHLPMSYAGAGSVLGFQLTWATALGLLGGFLAAMWPCLFQLTVFFIPGMAGLSMSQARQGGQDATVRARVLRTAVLFALGIIVVYTLAGAAAGLAAQTVAGSSLFQEARRPLMVVAGVGILFMAVRVAAQARAPLVCKMPVVSHLGRRAGPPGPLATMATGVAFATGCMTCFGAALALGMVTYIVSSASWLSGALLMFVFSLGISIPLVAASVAMARALPLLGKLEHLAPRMALASSAVMAAFALLLISDNYHVVSNLAYLAVAQFGG